MYAITKINEKLIFVLFSLLSLQESLTFYAVLCFIFYFLVVGITKPGKVLICVENNFS